MPLPGLLARTQKPLQTRVKKVPMFSASGTIIPIALLPFPCQELLYFVSQTPYELKKCWPKVYHFCSSDGNSSVAEMDSNPPIT